MNPNRDYVPTIIEFVEHAWYLGLEISVPQRALLKAIYGLALDAEERACWTECTGREQYPGTPFSEVTVIAGARSGKDSRIAAPITLYEAIFGERKVVKGETPTIPLIAQDQRATDVAFGYIRDYALGSSRLEGHVEDERAAELRMTDHQGRPVRIKCFACTAKSIRGWSIPAAVMDEVAFFRVEAGANADTEVQTAVRRGGVGYARQRLVKISTPYLKGGVLYDDLKAYWATDDPDVLVWKASTQRMNPSISAERITRERRKDPAAARREYDAEFGDDVSTAFPREWLDLAVDHPRGARELGPMPNTRYVAAVDPSGGGTDAFTLAIVHHDAESGRMVHDVMYGWRGTRAEKIDLGSVVGEIATILRRYDLYLVVGDRYAGQWPAQKFREVGITYVPAEFDKSKAYLELTPWLAQGAIELMAHEELVHELALVEKRLKPGGKTPVFDHPKGGHDDYPNAVAHAVAELAKSLHPAIDIGVNPGPRARRDAGGGTAAEPEMAGVGPGRRMAGPFWASRGRMGFWGHRG
jgi:hypothetical protein